MKVFKMRLDDILDDTIELLIANEKDARFKKFGDLAKSKFQHSKGEDARFLMSDKYKGQVANIEAIKKGHKTRKKNPNYEENIKKAALKRAAWYNNPENKEKFMKKIKNRKI